MVRSEPDTIIPRNPVTQSVILTLYPPSNFLIILSKERGCGWPMEGTGPPDKLFFTYLAFLFSTSWTSCECFSFEWTFSSKTQTWGNLWTCQEAEGGLDIGSWRNFMETSSWEALKKGCLLLAAPSASGGTYLRNVLSFLPEASTQRTFF